MAGKKGVKVGTIKMDYEKVDRVLKENGLTRTDASLILGMSKTWLSGKVSTKAKFSEEMLQRLALALRVDQKELILQEPESEPEKEEPKAEAQAAEPSLAMDEKLVDKVINELIDVEEIARQLKALNDTCEAILAELAELRTPEKSERKAKKILAKLFSAEGGKSCILYEDFRNALKQEHLPEPSRLADDVIFAMNYYKYPVGKNVYVGKKAPEGAK